MGKRTLPLGKVYGLIEPGPVLLLTTHHNGRDNVMVHSWHTMMEFEPPLIGSVISNRGFSHAALAATGECVLAIPPADMLETVVQCGNHSGRDIDKISQFGMQTMAARDICAPLLKGCIANLECRVEDTRLAEDYCFFVLQVTHAWHDPKLMEKPTLHHMGHGRFMLGGRIVQTESRAL